jgi:ribosomal-protein-alanine N-acetyltransferase
VVNDFEQLALEDLKRLALTGMDQADAEKVAAWRYLGIYAFYDFRADPEDAEELLDAHHRDGTYFSAHVPDFGLIGFAELKPSPSGELEIGLGLRPECTGRGLGGEYTRRVCDWATERVKPDLLVLRVATFNKRAIRVYRRIGFRPARVEIIDSYGTPVEFLRMERSSVPEP